MKRSTFVYAKISGVLGRTFKASKQTDARKMKKATQEVGVKRFNFALNVFKKKIRVSKLMVVSWRKKNRTPVKIMKISKLHHLFKAMFHC